MATLTRLSQSLWVGGNTNLIVAFYASCGFFFWVGWGWVGLGGVLFIDEEQLYEIAKKVRKNIEVYTLKTHNTCNKKQVSKK